MPCEHGVPATVQLFGDGLELAAELVRKRVEEIKALVAQPGNASLLRGTGLRDSRKQRLHGASRGQHTIRWENICWEIEKYVFQKLCFSLGNLRGRQARCSIQDLAGTTNHPMPFSGVPCSK